MESSLEVEFTNDPSLSDLGQIGDLPVELIIFYGPPCSGKTFYYMGKLAETHKKVDCTKVFRDKPELSFHRLVQTVIKYLEEGENVVIDDENRLRRTRRSFIKAVKAQVPYCTISCVSFLPLGGIEQCKWANEWALAERAITTSNLTRVDDEVELKEKMGYYEPTEQKWDEWEAICFGIDGVEKPSKDENFSVINEVSAPLLCNLCGSLDNTGLLVDAAALLSISGDGLTMTCVSTAAAVLREWSLVYPDGRIIVLIDETNLFPSSLELHALEPENFNLKITLFWTQILSLLNSLDVGIPIYYIRSKYRIRRKMSFFDPPCLGMFAWLQYRHKLCFKSSLFVFCEDSPLSTTCTNIIPSINGNDFFELNRWSIMSRIRRHSIPSRNEFTFLESIEKSTEHAFKSNTIENEENSLPLYVEYLSQERGHPVEEHSSGGRVHGVCWSDRMIKNTDDDIFHKTEGQDVNHDNIILIHDSKQKEDVCAPSSEKCFKQHSHLLNPKPELLSTPPRLNHQLNSPRSSGRKLPGWMSPGGTSRSRSPSTPYRSMSKEKQINRCTRVKTERQENISCSSSGISKLNSNSKWSTMFVPELKKALRTRGLKVKGRKSELITRLEHFEKTTKTLEFDSTSSRSNESIKIENSTSQSENRKEPVVVHLDISDDSDDEATSSLQSQGKNTFKKSNKQKNFITGIDWNSEEEEEEEEEEEGEGEERRGGLGGGREKEEKGKSSDIIHKKKQPSQEGEETNDHLNMESDVAVKDLLVEIGGNETSDMDELSSFESEASLEVTFDNSSLSNNVAIVNDDEVVKPFLYKSSYKSSTVLDLLYNKSKKRIIQSEEEEEEEEKEKDEGDDDSQSKKHLPSSNTTKKKKKPRVSLTSQLLSVGILKDTSS